MIVRPIAELEIYLKKLPSIVHILKKGIFCSKYLQSYAIGITITIKSSANIAKINITSISTVARINLKCVVMFLKTNKYVVVGQ